MGSGKTTVGRALAGALGVPFVDLDGVIEAQAGMPVRDIFARQGEPAFRELEHQALVEVSSLPAAVVATGGGTITFPRNLDILHRTGISVWLNPSFATIMRRIGALGKRDRPLFRGEAEALALYRSRLDAYRRADLRVDVGVDETPEEVAARIALRLETSDCGT
ncbi:MAG TPA: shikimate kinase [Thermoanaerobaculia bacterium]|nr:shikimate kinase [Thermoanaerobaculia bacterium]